MAGIVRRFTSVPTLEVIQEIEGLVIVDLAPPAPVTGAGSGTVLLVGEFEDGYFATDEEAQGAVEVFGSPDYQQKFGGFGYTYAGVPACNPSARRSLAENWNGNGFLKSWKLRCSRLLIARVDTSVGEVTLSVLPTIKGRSGPWALAVGMILSATTNVGTGTTAAIAATAATVTGTGASFATITPGESIGVTIDDGSELVIAFAASDTSVTAVVARINAALGATVAQAAAGQLQLTGLRLGTSGRIVLRDVSAGTLAKLGLTAGTVAGGGNVSDLSGVTAAEVAALVNASASMTAARVRGQVGSDGLLWLYHQVSASASTLQVDPGTGGMGAALGFVLDTDVSLATMPAGTIPAGTRVSASAVAGSEWVTMQTLDVPAGHLEPFTVRVRPGLDDGSHPGATAGQVNTIADAPAFAQITVSNADALSAALTEAQRDAAYVEALDATLNELGECRKANYLLVARRSAMIATQARANALQATEIGFFGRKYINGPMLGTSPDQQLADVDTLRSDRLFYAGLAVKTTVPVIAKRGIAGGQGFTADGVITVRADGPLTTLCASLPPEEDIGQQTGLVDDFFAVNAYGNNITTEVYKAFKRNGICAPRLDRTAGMIFQSDVTSSLESGRELIMRRRFADFIQDSAIGVFMPYSKRLAREVNRMRCLARWNEFLASLQSKDAPAKSRLAEFKTDDGPNAGNTDATLAQGVYFIATQVRQHSSLKFIVLQTEISPNTVITRTL